MGPVNTIYGPGIPMVQQPTLGPVIVSTTSTNNPSLPPPDNMASEQARLQIQLMQADLEAKHTQNLIMEEQLRQAKLQTQQMGVQLHILEAQSELASDVDFQKKMQRLQAEALLAQTKSDVAMKTTQGKLARKSLNSMQKEEARAIQADERFESNTRFTMFS